MNTYSIIKKAILTEKAHVQMNRSVYSFLVDGKANKKSVALSVKNLFNVDPIAVNIVAVKKKQKRIGRTKKFTLVGGGKKAIVTLKPGQTIAALSPKTESKDKKPKKSGGEKDIQKVKVEGKEGA